MTIKIDGDRNGKAKCELLEIEKSVGAEIVMADGTSVPIESMVTIEDVSTSNHSARFLDSSDGYKVTVQATASDDKIDSDSGPQNNSKFNVSATLQLIWTDGAGLDNVIKKYKAHVLSSQALLNTLMFSGAMDGRVR